MGMHCVTQALAQRGRAAVCQLIGNGCTEGQLDLVRSVLVTAGVSFEDRPNIFASSYACADIVVFVDGSVMGGRSLSRRVLRARVCQPQIPVLVVSADRRAASLAACFESGATDYVRIPFEHQELLARFQRALGFAAPEIERPRLVIEENACVVRNGQQLVTFGKDGFSVFMHLYERRDVWCESNELRRAALGSHLSSETSNLRWHVMRIRNLLGVDRWWIHSDRRLGYMFSFASCSRAHCAKSVACAWTNPVA
jgi:DNA-binding response OmpR family regulator